MNFRNYKNSKSSRAVIFLVLALMPSASFAQDFSFPLADGVSLNGRAVQLIGLITILSLSPGIIMMVTSFPLLITVFAILRQAIGLQQSPPNMLIVSLALFLTYFIMEPEFKNAWQLGLRPMIEETIDVETGLVRSVEPFRNFMAGRTNENTINTLAALRRPETVVDNESAAEVTSPPLSVLIPSFMLSEISRAFQIGFIVFLPFLIIDLLVAAILMSMGMMMVPPAIVSLPFKLGFFVIVDGWSLIASSLARSYSF